jgi:predicted enzyme related to lactoylglutathione lyase
MANKHGDFIWYELMTNDIAAAQSFYGGLLGWTFADAGMPEGEYHLFSADGPPVGGLMPITADMKSNGAMPMWAGYIGVDDVDQSVTAATAAGGSVLMPAWDVNGVGRMAMLADPQGAPFYVLEDSSGEVSESFAQEAARNGHCAWNELATASPADADSFYCEVFGWEKAETMDMGPMGEYPMYKNGADRSFMLGGMMKKPDEMPVSMWSYYFRVANIDSAVEFVKGNGGQVLNGPMEVPGDEYVINGLDPQGAMFSIVGVR